MGNLAVIHDEHHQRLEMKLKRELRDLVLPLLSDDHTEDILLNPNGSLWAKRMGEGFYPPRGEVAAAQAWSALSTIAAWRGTVLNHEHPTSETELPIDGSRFEGIVSQLVRRPVFAALGRPNSKWHIRPALRWIGSNLRSSIQSSSDCEQTKCVKSGLQLLDALTRVESADREFQKRFDQSTR